LDYGVRVSLGLGLLALIVVGPRTLGLAELGPLAIVVLMAAAGLVVGYRLRVAALVLVAVLGATLAHWTG
jgi:hypothetical protein